MGFALLAVPGTTKAQAPRPPTLAVYTEIEATGTNALISGIINPNGSPAPTVRGLPGQGVFARSPLVFVYYLPGTTGWRTTLGGAQALLWNPQAQTSDGGFGIQQNDFGFNITGTADIPLVVEACTDLRAADWIPLQTCTLTNGFIRFHDAEWVNHSARFYRIRSP